MALEPAGWLVAGAAAEVSSNLWGMLVTLHAMRVRLYRAGLLEADTDPDLGEMMPGAERVETMSEAQRGLLELCRDFHGPDVRLLGFGDDACRAYLSMMYSRAETSDGRPWQFTMGYSVLLDTPQLRQTTSWAAEVDIVAVR